ncbi:MAG: fibronectin type III domain-containing protein, partial [bacterium]
MSWTRRSLILGTVAATVSLLLVGCGGENSSEPDTTAPAAITDLEAGTTGCDSAVLTWTAPGDDSASGRASSYDLRYSTAAINATNWTAATPFDGEQAPKTAGQPETLTVTGLASGTTYHFALVARDDAGNDSDVSNDASAPVGTTAIAWVNDGAAADEDWWTSPTSLSANWASACVSEYEYALGTSPGATDVIGWTSAGTATQVTRIGLSLAEGEVYYWSVRGILALVPGTPTSSDGIAVDSAAPTSQVSALPTEVPTLVFTVTWSGSDATSGIKQYDIQVSSDGGSSWGIWLTGTTLTSSAFTGINGHTYHFRSRAWDNAANAEAYPATPDAHTTVRLTTGLQVEWVHDGQTLGIDDDWINQTSTLYAYWPAVAGAEGYEVAIGTSSGSTEIMDWYPLGLSTGVAAGTLPLTEGGTYYVSVRVVVGVTRGPWVSSDGITRDTLAPMSQVSALPPVTSSSTLFLVEWSGSDGGSGVNSYDVQMRDGDGPWQDWMSGTAATSQHVLAEIDHTYYFRSRAYDVAGNVEAYPSTADASTCVTCALAYSAQWGHDGSGPGEFHYPYGIALDQLGNIYVTETSGRVQKFDPNGQYLLEWGTSGPGILNLATSAAVDDSGYIYVTDTGGDKVKKFKSDGEFVKEWGGHGDGDGQFIYPRGIAIDDSG